MRQLNSTLRNRVRVRFESKSMDLYWEAGSNAFETAEPDAKEAVRRLIKISQQKGSGRSRGYNEELARLARAEDLKVAFY